MNLEAISISLRYLTGSLFTVPVLSACSIIFVVILEFTVDDYLLG
jgi:hypothetical protein